MKKLFSFARSTVSSVVRTTQPFPKCLPSPTSSVGSLVGGTNHRGNALLLLDCSKEATTLKSQQVGLRCITSVSLGEFQKECEPKPWRSDCALEPSPNWNAFIQRQGRGGMSARLQSGLHTYTGTVSEFPQGTPVGGLVIRSHYSTGERSLKVWYTIFGKETDSVSISVTPKKPLTVKGFRSFLAKNNLVKDCEPNDIVVADHLGNNLKPSKVIEKNDEDTAYEVIPIPATDKQRLVLFKKKIFGDPKIGQTEKRILFGYLDKNPIIGYLYPTASFVDLKQRLRDAVEGLSPFSKLKLFLEGVTEPMGRLSVLERWATGGKEVPRDTLKMPDNTMSFAYRPRTGYVKDAELKKEQQTLKSEKPAELYVLDDSVGKFKNLYAKKNPVFSRTSQGYLFCAAVSGMGKSRFGYEAFEQMRKLAVGLARNNPNKYTEFSELLGQAQHIYVEFNGSGNGYFKNRESGLKGEEERAALMGLRIFLAGRCNKTLKDILSDIVTNGSLKEFVSLMSGSLQPWNLFPYMAERWREQNNLGENDLVMFYLHVDEYQLVPPKVMHDMLRPIMEYLADGNKSTARQDNVFITMLTTGTLSTGIEDVIGAIATTRGFRLLKLQPLPSLMDLALNDESSCLSKLSEESKEILRDNVFFRVFLDDLGGIPRYLEVCLAGKEDILSPQEFSQELTGANDPSPIIKKLLEQLAPFVNTRVREYVVTNVASRIDFVPFIDVIIAGVRVPEKQKFGEYTVEQIEEAGLIQVTPGRRIQAPTVLLMCMAPKGSLMDLPFPLLETVSDTFEDMVIKVELARQRALKSVLKKEIVRISELFPGAKGEEALLDDEVILPPELKIASERDGTNYQVLLNYGDKDGEEVDVFSTIWKTKEKAQGLDAFRVLKRNNDKKPFLFLYQFKGAFGPKSINEPSESKKSSGAKEGSILKPITTEKLKTKFLDMAAKLFSRNSEVFSQLLSQYQVVYLYVNLHEMTLSDPNKLVEEYAELVKESFANKQEKLLLNQDGVDLPKLLVVSGSDVNDFMPNLAHRLQAYPTSTSSPPSSPNGGE